MYCLRHRQPSMSPPPAEGEEESQRPSRRAYGVCWTRGASRAYQVCARTVAKRVVSMRLGRDGPPRRRTSLPLPGVLGTFETLCERSGRSLHSLDLLQPAQPAPRGWRWATLHARSRMSASHGGVRCVTPLRRVACHVSCATRAASSCAATSEGAARVEEEGGEVGWAEEVGEVAAAAAAAAAGGAAMEGAAVAQRLARDSSLL